jgi:hypothetical protein
MLRQSEVGAIGLDVDLGRAREPFDHARLPRRQRPPGSDRIGLVEEQGTRDERLVVGRAHPRLLGERRGRPDRAAPARREARLLQLPPAARRARDKRRVGAGQLGGVERRLDSDASIDRLGLDELERGERVELAWLRIAVEVRVDTGRRQPQQRPAAALQDGAMQRRGGLLSERRRRDQNLLAAADLEAPVGDQGGERIGVDHGASNPGKCSLTCSRRLSRTNWRSSWLAIR